MVNKCSAYGCRSGYKGAETDKNVQFHCFPLHNKQLCDKWVAANPRKDFTPSQHSTICSLHFKPSDYLADHEDTNTMNVKSSCKGKHKRNYTMDPVRSSQDWKLDFLREIADFLLRWEN